MFYEPPSAPITGSTAPFKGYDYQELYDYFIPEADAQLDKDMMAALHFFKHECQKHWYNDTSEGMKFKPQVMQRDMRDNLYWITHDGIHQYYQKQKRDALFHFLENLTDTDFAIVRTQLNLFLEALISQSDEEHAEIFLYLRGISSRRVFLHMFKMNLFTCWS